ncbi:MAG: type II toxin-antitoxin system ParD family antitoxin [Verrucomicrobiae bacterium]|nr:type II toxin-antitoxin system ParD family antitoxin [Verrucomicrobiae bacterium]
MPTQNVNLTPELDGFVKRQVEGGFFNNASEVHRAALAAMAREEEERQARLERLRNEIGVGLEDLDAGRYRAVSSEGEHQAFLSEIKVKAMQRRGNA